MDEAVGPVPPSTVPVACTLGPGDGQASLRRWRRLNESATSSARIVAGTLQVRYQPGPGVQEELTALAASEQTCCSFVSWSVTNSDGQPVLLVSAPAEAPDAVAPIAATVGAADAPTSCPADRAGRASGDNNGKALTSALYLPKLAVHR